MESKNNNILINVLTRTSGRPFGFRKCYTSIKEQTYKNIKHIVSYDDKADLCYLKDLNIDLIDVTTIKETELLKKNKVQNNLTASYNLYCNSLLDFVEEGWILFLDDDDNLYHNKVIEEIIVKIQSDFDEDTLFIWQMRYPDGKLLPTNNQIIGKTIKKYNIGSPCFLFHSKHKKNIYWDDLKGSDFRFLQQICEKVTKTVFIQKVMVQINNYGDLGQRNDLSDSYSVNYKMPSSFYKNLLWFITPKYHFKFLGVLFFHKSTFRKFFMIFSK
ncbi:hypothetical protein [Bizionia sp.]|uniref:hypothetical protein n=1 Tax=Bizionia sp. TaxID=1954480 RepID=UPI003A8CFB35